MVLRLKQFLLCLVVLPLLPQVGLGQTGGALPSIEGRYFEVVGTDYRSVSYVNELGTHVVEVCSRYLQPSAEDFPQAIFVALRPEDRVEFEGDYLIRRGDRGSVSLDIRWEASLTQETLCRALVEAYAIRYAIFNYGPNAATRVRFWAVSALAAQSYLSLRPAQQVSYIEACRQDGVPALAPLLQLALADAPFGTRSGRLGYWVSMSLQQLGFDRAGVGDFIEKAIAGMDVSVELESLLQPTDVELEKVSLENWWQWQVGELLRLDYEACETMFVSLDWLTQMADFEAYRNAGGELGNLRTLWSQREDAALRSILSARGEIIRLRLQRVNPAYYNAAQSLGALYETVLVAERMDAFIHALVAYLRDWEDTKRLHLQIQELLGQQ